MMAWEKWMIHAVSPTSTKKHMRRVMVEGKCTQSPSQPKGRGLAARGAVVQENLITRLCRQLQRTKASSD